MLATLAMVIGFCTMDQNHTVNVTGFGKTDHNVTIDVSRNTDLKY